MLTTRPIRSISLGAIVVVVIYVLLLSFDVGPHRIEQTTRESLQTISRLAPDSWRYHGSKVTKVTELFGVENELYEAALQSHEEHNRNLGYEMKVMRKKIVNKYLSKPTYLLSLIVEELAKAEGSKAEWLLWHDPDVIILNPRIPLEVFLPPHDFAAAHLLATQSADGFDGGIFFLRVHEWSVKMLLEVISLNAGEAAEASSDRSFERVLRNDKFRAQVVYQPRIWYNAYQINSTYFEGEPGDLLVHFADISGDKWMKMAELTDQPNAWWKKWNVPLEQTTYESDIADYWDRIRKAYQLMSKAQSRMDDSSVHEPFQRLQYATTYEMDREDKIRPAMIGLQEVLDLQGDDRVV